MNKALKIIGFLGIFALTSLAMEDPFVFVNIPSLVIVGGLTFFGLLASGHKIISTVSVIVDNHADPKQIYEASDALRAAGNFSVGGGVLGVLIGVVLMLGSLTDPAALGPSMAVALLTALYAVFLKYFIYNPLINVLDVRADEIYDQKDKSE